MDAMVKRPRGVDNHASTSAAPLFQCPACDPELRGGMELAPKLFRIGFAAQKLMVMVHEPQGCLPILTEQISR